MFDCQTIDVDKKAQKITLIGHDGNFVMLSDFWSSGELTKDTAEWIADNFADIDD